MKIFVKKGVLADTKSQAIILTLFEDSKKLTGAALATINPKATAAMTPG